MVQIGVVGNALGLAHYPLPAPIASAGHASTDVSREMTANSNPTDQPAPDERLRLVAPAADGRPSSPTAGSLQEFFIPVHGLVRLHEDELPIVDHPAFQRLGFVYQLGQTYVVYRGATHTRLEHAVGTRHVAELMIEALKRNCSQGEPDPDRLEGEWQLDVRLNPTEERFVRLGALLHDIGHLPAGHTLEDELGLLGAHDRHERLRLVFDRNTWSGVEVERTLREIIDERFAADAIASGLRHPKGGPALTPTEIVELLISKEPPPVSPSDAFRHGVCRDIIGNTICADLLDYLHRDWYHIGKERFFDTRLLEYLEIRARETPSGRDARLVINLRSGHRVRTDAVTAILDLLESRYQLAEIALFHRTKLSAAAMLERAIAEIGDHYPTGVDGLLAELPEMLLDASDTEMLDQLGARAVQALDSRAPAPDEDAKAALTGAVKLTKGLRLRRLHALLGSAFEYELPRAAKRVQDTYAGPETAGKEKDREKARQANARKGAENRRTAVRLLERDFGLPPGSLVMYCPSRTMNTKIAQVQVLIHQEVYRLEDFEATERTDRGITGGHLEAQKDRFRRLWRIQFGIDRDEKKRLAERGLLPFLGRAIELCVLRKEPVIGRVDEAVAALAVELTRVPNSPLYGREVVPAEAARGRAHATYPGGAMSLLDLTEERKDPSARRGRAMQPRS